MTKALERIWAYEAYEKVTAARSTTWFPAWAEPHEYVLNDYALALVAAENEACADIVACQCQCGPISLEVKLRGRTTDDAIAALERAKQEARNEALREVASLSWLCFHKCNDEIDVVTTDDILALITEDQSDGK